MALISLSTRLRHLCRLYPVSSQGNVTMFAALVAIPIIAASGMAIDYVRISRVHDKIQAIADGAALAAASAKNISGSTDQMKASRVLIAKNYLTRGLAGLTDVSSIGAPVVAATTSEVSVAINATVKGSLINVLDVGKSRTAISRKYNMAVNSKAGWTNGASSLCMLVLNPSAAQSLEIQGTADLYAPGCTVWVNSGSTSGLYENGTATLTAKKICVTGNYYGSQYFPYKPKWGAMDCPAYADPLKAKFATDYNATYASATVRYKGYSSTSKKYTQYTLSGNGTTTLQPGIYDGGIQIKSGATAKLAAGTYFIQNGKFEVQQGTVSNADSGGVTIVMTEPTAGTKVTNGTQTRIDITAQSTVTLKAPSSGYFAGIVIAQHPNSITSATKTTANSVIGGGTKSLTGIVYYPTNILYITGGGTGTVSHPEKIATDDPLFAIVADKVMIEGNGQLRIGGAADSGAAGLPALPSSGSGGTVVSLK